MRQLVAVAFATILGLALYAGVTDTVGGASVPRSGALAQAPVVDVARPSDFTIRLGGELIRIGLPRPGWCSSWLVR